MLYFNPTWPIRCKKLSRFSTFAFKINNEYITDEDVLVIGAAFDNCAMDNPYMKYIPVTCARAFEPRIVLCVSCKYEEILRLCVFELM